MPIDYEQIRADRVAAERDRQDRDAIEGAKLNHRLSESEAAFLVGRRQFEAAEAEKKLHEQERHSFANHCLNRAVEATKAGNAADQKTWSDGYLAIVVGKWPIHKTIRSDPHVMKYAELRTRLNYRGENTQLDEE